MLNGKCSCILLAAFVSMSSYGGTDTPSTRELVDEVKTTYRLDRRIQSNMIDEVELSAQSRKALIFAIQTIPTTIDLGMVTDDLVQKQSQRQVEPRSYVKHVESISSDFIPEEEIDHSLLELVLTEATLELGDIRAILRVLGERQTKFSAAALIEIENNVDVIVDGTLEHEDISSGSHSLSSEQYDQMESVLERASGTPLEAQLRSVLPLGENLNALSSKRKEHLEISIINAARRHGHSDLSVLLYKLAASENELVRNTAYDAIKGVEGSGPQ
ncbi:hypothetical protein [Haliea sp.]|jgi:hypothetical protein|uniref:hypothetical protein n=1 Tax=Haliea sp. TaxID=1932666 RepID=UPI00258087C6|nr:hypothetical protein [Haliea sp.]